MYQRMGYKEFERKDVTAELEFIYLEKKDLNSQPKSIMNIEDYREYCLSLGTDVLCYLT